ncbi:MAG: stage III sporulation protein AA [Epulopiscium sp. Nele67-Bin004]|nr:MAG: stage III sporulation protein AA [Epulopiscium sp. Nele67-Bin004]
MDTIENVMPAHIKQMLQSISPREVMQLEEIRLRVGRPIVVELGTRSLGLCRNGTCDISKSYVARRDDVDGILKFISGFSPYALTDDLRQGYITIEGGHRVGVVGKAVVENGTVKTLRDISGMNIRIARQMIGCSDKIMPYIFRNRRLCHTLIVSPPKCGKTTVLRDIVRNLSDGSFSGIPLNVGVVDERSEIAGCYRGIPQNNVGMRTDVLDGCPKVEGIYMLLRSMAPQVIAVDEIGKKEDYDALLEALGVGVSILCTVHGYDLNDCYKKPELKDMIRRGFFERILVLTNTPKPGTIKQILDQNGTSVVIQ